MLKVTIVIPVYNGEKYLDKCLKSVVSQTLKEIEIICIDNNSSDGTMEILKKFQKQDNRIKIISKDKNTGYGSSINLGIKRASGKYIGFVESDDYVSIKMYENLYKLAKKNQVEVVKCNYFCFTKNKKYKKNLFLKNELNKIINPLKQQHILSENSCIWSAIYKRSFLIKNKINCIEKQNHSYEDTSFTFKVFSLAKKVFFTSNALYYYRTDNQMSSVKSKKYFFAIIDEYKEIEKFLRKIKKNNLFSASFTRAKFYGCKWNIERLRLFDSLCFSKLVSNEFKQDKKNNFLNTSKFSNYCSNDLSLLLKCPFLYTIKTKLKIKIKNI